ncbi:hypothetical protein SSPSH_000060 [Salinisphaera shabanensis E1L3A]|uniref:Uncharacterized protein n=1 Tax=Salinisphaera shabanensis E1L3A TaxID=1033802 RepID=U2G3L9_9GAMM|nr:hypothetical protein [Salinisphaera shabanensis]ERJ20718.1 hypothetical protein SSPSH_000060 [Salinisphaera shabanensis E1L3A]
MCSIERSIKADSLPVPDVPEEYALEVRDRIIEDRQATEDIDRIGAVGSRMRHEYEIAARLFFDQRMRNFWTQARKKGPTDRYLEYLDEQEKAEEENYGKPLRSRQLLHEKPLEVALKNLAIYIQVLTYPLPRHLNGDTKTRKRELDRVIGSLRNASQALRGSPYYDVPVLGYVRTPHLRHYVSREIENYRDQFIEVFNPSLALKINQIDNAIPVPVNPTDEAMDDWLDKRYAASDSLIALEGGTLDEDDINTLFEQITDSITGNFNKNADRAFKLRKLGDDEAPESLSEFLDNISDKLNSVSESIQIDPDNPRPNEKNASLRAFCRRLDSFLREAFQVSSPTQVAICANVVLGATVDADKVKSWRIDS